MSANVRRYWSAYRRVPGWFDPADFLLFDWFLADQTARGVAGDLLEVGAFLGRSAVVLGLHAGPEDTVDVCDLFEAGAGGASRGSYAGTAYRGLSRGAFEENYSHHVPRLPRVHQRPSAELIDVLAPGYRFIHLDGSHVYGYVRADVATAVALLQPKGVVSVDDYRNEHFPGVAAAVWAEVAAGGLVPICVTSAKLYASNADPAPVQARMRAWLADHRVLESQPQEMSDGEILCISMRRPASVHDVLRELTPPAVSRLMRRDRGWRGGPPA
jgi:hypothetical protein